MKILAVNINKQLASRLKVLPATERAWKLDETKFRKNLPDFVIGVANGKIQGYFRLQAVFKDILPNRLRFSLINCNKNEIALIDSFTKDKNLRYFVTKLVWEIK